MQLRKIILRTSLSALCLLIAGVFYLRFGGYFFSDKENRSKIINEIKNSPKLPERFYTIYNKIHPGSLEKGQLSYVINKHMLVKRGIACPCYDVVYPKYRGIKQILFTFYIEDHVSQRDCLTYLANNTDFLNNNIGIDMISEFYYQKNPEELSDREIIGLIISMNNPFLHNKIRRPEKYEESIK